MTDDSIKKTGFNFQPTLSGKNISLRPLCEDDFDELYTCASDKKIWQGHPSSDRYKHSEFVPYFKASIESRANVVVIDNQSNKIIGLSRYYQVDKIPDDISIGFTFLARDYWGGTTNLELKTLMIEYALQYFPAVWLHVGLSNIRSQKATLKIGAKFMGEDDLVIAGKQGKWLCYKVDKESWYGKN